VGEEELLVPKCDANSSPHRRAGGGNVDFRGGEWFPPGSSKCAWPAIFSRATIDDAPVRLGKALSNTPMLHPALIDAGGSLDRDRTRGIAYRGETVHGRLLCYYLRGTTQQVLSGAGEDATSFHNPYPGSATGNRPSFRLLVGEPCQSAQVTRAGTRQVASVSMSQVLTDNRGHGSFQGCGCRSPQF
jgi:hypothetical protein